MILGICDSPNVLEVMLIVTKVITIIKIIVPIILIVSLMVSFAKAVSQNDSDALDKAKKGAVSKVIAAVLVFFIPTFVDVIVGLVDPNSEYKECISDISRDTIDNAYSKVMDDLVSKAEETKTYSDYSVAYNYLANINDQNKKETFQERLAAVKQEIEESRKPQTVSSEYSKVNYKAFKWKYYKANTGPLKDYESKFNPYAVYAPENESDLNGVSLPLIIWLHGSGEKNVGEKAFLNSGLLKVVSDWDNYNLEPIPAIIVAPQATPGWWGGYESNHKTIYALVEYAKSKYNINPERVVLMGHSMGAHGVLELTLEMKKLNLYAAVTMSTQREDYGGKEGKAFYSKLKMKGYGEYASHQKFYDWIGQSENYTYYKGVSHGSVPKKALTEDLNKDGISDLMYWLFGSDASTKPVETQTTPETTTPGTTTPGSTTPTNTKPTADPITNHVNISSVNIAIANAVKARGLYTREAVVSAATTLVNKLSASNYHVPYQLGGMYHRGTAWGLNPNWGIVITHNNQYVLSGLDCRNFVNWTFKQAGLSLIRGYGYEGAINNKYGDVYSNFGDGRPGDVIDASEHIMLIIKNDKGSGSYTVAQSWGGYGVQLKTYKYSELQGSIKYKVYNMDGVYSNTGLWCPEKSSYRAYSGSCYIPKSEFPSYYGF